MAGKFSQLKESAEKLGDNTVDRFMSSGLDYKGQAQLAYTADGWGTSAEASIDPGKIIGLAAEVGVSASVKRAKEILVVAHRGPRVIPFDAANPVQNPRPVTLSCLMGVFWEGAVGATLDVGVKFSASLGADSKGGEAKAESSLDPSDDEDKATSVEGVALSFEAKAGFSASAGYKYHNLYAEDFSPQFYDAGEGANEHGKKELRDTLERVLADGSVKALIKRGACDFINRNSREFGTIRLETFTGNTAAASISAKLRSGIANCNFRTNDGLAKAIEAQNWMAKLAPFAGGVAQKGLAFLRLTCHSPSAEAGFTASIKAEASAGPLVTGTLSASAKAANIAISGKRAYMRHQFYTNSEPVLVCTQDTIITYLSFDLTTLQLSAKAELSSQVFGKGTSTSETRLGKRVSEGVIPSEYSNPLALNRMTYASSIVYWQKPEPLDSPIDRKETVAVTALQGSGVAFGQSCVLKNLLKLYDAYDFQTKAWVSVLQRWYAERLADALHVSLDELMKFLEDAGVESMIKSLATQDDALAQATDRMGGALVRNTVKMLGEERARAALKKMLKADFGSDWGDRSVLLESSFSIPASTKVNAVRQRKWRSTGIISKTRTAEDYFILDANVRQAFMDNPAFAPRERSARLQAIRLRYRISDIHDGDKTRFTLGIKIAGTGAKVKLEQVERAGSEGIVDVATVWMDPQIEPKWKPYVFEGKNRERLDVAGAYDACVPPVTLFCQ